jgi:hypothetical protein
LNIVFESIYNIQLKYINANYPININHNQGYHIIDKIYNNYYFRIKLSKKYYGSNIVSPITSSTITKFEGGFSNIFNIGKIINVINGYSDPNLYSFDFNKTFNNVFKIELLSSEIPNSDYNVNNSLSINYNSVFEWQILDDADVVYSVVILPGIYDT